jgi:cell division protease FtsH
MIDSEVKHIVDFNYARAKKVLEGHREGLQRLAEALLEYESLDAEDIDAVLAGQPPSLQIQQKSSGSGRGETKEKEKEKKTKTILSPTPPIPTLNEGPEKA